MNDSILSADLVKNLKADTLGKFEIEVYDIESKPIGFLSLLQKADTCNQHVVESLTKWRNKYMRFFLTQFTATTERTKAWLTNVVIPSSDKLLFLIRDYDRNLIGNFGVANISKDKCELDNLIRGERGGHPKLVYFSEIALLKWLFDKGVNQVNLHVFSNNWPTIKLHKSVGFLETIRTIVSENIGDNGEVSYMPGPSCDGSRSREYIEMTMKHEMFNEIYDFYS